VIATLNERENIRELINRIHALSIPPFEIVVVDDGSTDGTRESLLEMASGDERIQLIFHDIRRTLIPAQIEGIAECRGRVIVIMDADLQHPPEAIPSLIDPIYSGADLVVGTRYITGGSTGNRPAFRAVVSHGAEILAKLMIPETRKVSDTLSGFFAFNREMYLPLRPDSRGFKLILPLHVMRGRRRVVEVPYVFGDRNYGASKIVHDTSFMFVFLRELLVAKRLQMYLGRHHSEPQSLNRSTAVAHPTSPNPSRATETSSDPQTLQN